MKYLLLGMLAISATTPAIQLDVYPRVAVVNPYKTSTFRVMIRIPEHKDNRLYSYSADCGGEVKSGQREIRAITEMWFEELHVKSDCYFLACLHRIVEGKVKNFCEHVEISTGEDP